MEKARLSSKGQLVLPRNIREQLRLKSGNEFSVEIEGGKIILEPLSAERSTHWSRWRGACKGESLLDALKTEHQKEMEIDEKNI
jgi:AbrB family looped-hinge helix DNA binding protein